MSGPLGRVQTGLGRVGKGIGQVGSGLSQLGTRAAVAAAAGLGAVITTAASMEEAFIGVQKTVDETANTSFPELRAELRQMSSDTGTAFEELAAIGEAGGAMGIGADSLESFIDVVNRLAVSTDLSSEAAAISLGQLTNVLGLSQEELHDFSDSLVALGNAGASTESQIVEIAARFGAAGKAAGLSKEDILALASTTASLGIEVEAAGGSLSRLFNDVATSIGTSSAESKVFADALGLTADQFKKAWGDDALGTFNKFLEKLNTLDQFEAAALLKEVGITANRDVVAIRGLAGGYDELNKQIDISRGATDELNEESDKFYAGSANQLRRLRENFRLVADTIGTELLPITNELISDFVDVLNKPSTQAGIKAFAQDLAGGIRGLVSELRGTDFSGIIGGMKLAAEVAKGAFDAFRSLPQPIQQLAIAALVANKVSGGAIGSIAKGLGNILLGGLKTITAANVTVIGKTVIGPGGVPGAAPAAGGGVLAGALGVAVPVAAFTILASAFAGWFEENVAKPSDPTGFDYRAAALQSKEFANPNAANVFARDLAKELGVPLYEVERGIVEGIDKQGLSFDQSVSQLRSDLGPKLTNIGRTNEASRNVNEQIRAQVAASAEAQRQIRTNTADSARWAGNSQSFLSTIAAKETTFIANIPVTVNARLSVTQALYTGTVLNQIRLGNPGF